MYVPKRSGLLTAGDDDQADKDAEKRETDEIEREREAAPFLRRPSNIARIEEATTQYNFQALKLLASENEECLDRDVIIYNLEVQRRRKVGLLSLPFTLVFFFSFAYSAFQHEDITNRYVIESALGEAFGQDAASVTTISEAWHWLNTTLFPLVFRQTDYKGVPLQEKADWGRALSYNYLVGPLFIEQERSTKSLCDKDSSGIAEDMPCFYVDTQGTSTFGKPAPHFSITPPVNGEYAGANVTMEQRVEYYNKPFSAVSGTRRLRAMAATYQDRLSGGPLVAGIGQEGYFRAMFYSNMRYQLIQERLNYLFERQWLDKQTKHITIYGTWLNVEMGRPRLQTLTLTFSFARSGDIFRKLRMDTIFLKFYSGFTSIAADAAFVIFLLVVTILEIRELCMARKRRELRKHLFTGFFLLQAVTVIVGWGVLMGYQYTNMQLGPLVSELESINEASIKDVPPEHNDLGANFIDMAGRWAYMAGYVQIAAAQYHLPLTLRFFMAFRSQPRLGVVVNTLEACMLDILHFLVILFPSGIAYAISGCFVFGKRLEEFSDIKSAIGMCFKILTENEYDWPALSEEHFWTTGLWVWSFMVFLAMIMLNMVLAIVLDVYSEQRKSAGRSDSIIDTMKMFITIVKYRKTWLSSAKITEKLKLEPRLLARTDLAKLFPSMPEVQLNFIVSQAQLTSSNVFGGPEQAKQTFRMAMAMKVMMDKVDEAFEEVDSGSYAPEPGLQQLSDKNWVDRINRELSAQNHDMLSMYWKLQQLNWQAEALNRAHGSSSVFEPSPSKGLLNKSAALKADPIGIVWCCADDDERDTDVIVMNSDDKVV